MTIVALLGVLLAYVLVVLWAYQPYLVFEAETDAYFRRALAWLRGDSLSFRGPPMGPFHLHHGPLFYVVSAALMWISPQLEWLFVAWLLLSCCGAILLFRACAAHVGVVSALIAIFGLLSSSFAFEYSRQLWHSSLLPVVATGILFTIERGLATRKLRYFLIAAALSGVAVQLHIHSIGYAALVLFVIVRERQALAVRGIAACFGVFFLAAAPLLVAVGSVMSASGGEQIAGWLSNARGELLANPIDVVVYFLGHMGTAWGQTVSPWFSGVWIVLLCLGAYAVLRQGNAFGIVLLVNLALGLVVQSVLWGYMWAPWYLHVNMYAAFGLCGFGAHWVSNQLVRLPNGRTVVMTIMSIAGVAIIADASVSPPGVSLSARATLTAPEALALSRQIAPEAPCASDVNSRVHGVYYSAAEQLLGIGYLHQVATPAGTACRPDGSDILVTLADDRFTPLATNKPAVEVLTVHQRKIAIARYQSGIDRAQMKISGPYADILMSHWRDLEFHPPREPTSHTIEVVARVKGTLNVLLRMPGLEDECPVAIVTAGGPLKHKTETSKERFNRHVEAQIPKPGPVEIRIGPCPYVPFVDLF